MPAVSRAPSVGVVGHVEWVTHALGRLPPSGGIADLRDPLDEPAGGGGVAAAAVARATGRCILFTALGTDDRARRSEEILGSRGVEVLASRRTAGQTPVLSVTEPGGERTIMVVGARLQPAGADDLPWERLSTMDAAYYAGEDPGSLVHARSAARLVVTARRMDDLRATGVTPDAIVASAADPDEDPWGLPAALAPEVIILTEGARGGVIHERGAPERRFAAPPPPAPVVDTYGCGDTFAAVIAVALGQGLAVDDAVAIGAAAGAECATWRGGLGPTP